MKKIFLQTALIAVASSSILTTVSCGNKIDAKKTIAIVVSQQSNPFFQNIINSAKKEVEAKGYHLVVFDSKNKAEKELSNIETIVTKGYAGVIWNPTSDGVANAAKKLVNSKIPFTFVDRNVKGVKENIAFTRTDNVSSTKKVVEKAIKKFDTINKKNTLTIDGIYHLQGVDGASAAIDRQKGFIQAIKSSFADESTEPKISNTARADFETDKAVTKVNSWKTRDANKLKFIFAENDNMALGAAKVFEGTSSYPMIVGFDGLSSTKVKIDAGKIYATVEQDTAKMGKNAADIVLEVVLNDDSLITSVKKNDHNQNDLLEGKIYSNEKWPAKKS